jgi:serine/threonine-protein kinase
MLQGRFSVERVIGHGGMGAVYLVRHTQLGGRPMAVKEMIPAIANPEEREQALLQFRREAEMLFDLQHPNLVRVSDFFQEKGNQYLAMDYIDGSNVEVLLETIPAELPISVVLQWMEDISAVLEYLHRRNPPIILRDLKPANVMVDGNGRIRLIDFGIARVLRDGASTASFLKGAATAGYAPIEQYVGTTDNRTDIYSLGATFYALLTRKAPPISVARMNGDEMVLPSTINHQVTPELEAVMLKMMGLRPEERYQSVVEARQAFQQAARTVGPDAPSASFLNLDRTCGTCGTKALPMATTCLQCGSLILQDPYLSRTLGTVCEHCGMSLPIGTQNCPRCEVIQEQAQQSTAEITPTVQPAARAVVKLPADGGGVAPVGGGKTGMMVAGLVGIVIVAGGAYFAVHKSAESGAQHASLAGSGTVRIQIKPEGVDCEISVDGRPIEQPGPSYDLALPDGEHKITVKADHYKPVTNKPFKVPSKPDPLVITLLKSK